MPRLGIAHAFSHNAVNLGMVTLSCSSNFQENSLSLSAVIVSGNLRTKQQQTEAYITMFSNDSPTSDWLDRYLFSPFVSGLCFDFSIVCQLFVIKQKWTKNKFPCLAAKLPTLWQVATVRLFCLSYPLCNIAHRNEMNEYKKLSRPIRNLLDKNFDIKKWIEMRLTPEPNTVPTLCIICDFVAYRVLLACSSLFQSR